MTVLNHANITSYPYSQRWGTVASITLRSVYVLLPVNVGSNKGNVGSNKGFDPFSDSNTWLLFSEGQVGYSSNGIRRQISFRHFIFVR
jgi:hypothetical protein